MKRDKLRDWDSSASLPPRSSAHAKKQEEEALQQELEEAEEEQSLPPRGTAHPSEKRKWNTLYYRVLLLLFIGLTASLLYWGFRSLPS